MVIKSILHKLPNHLSRYHKVLFSAGLMIFFYALFDGLLSYILPIKIISLGFTKSQLGLIIASSNIFGALFDFLLAKFLPNTSYRRLFLSAYILCSLYGILIWAGNSLPYFLFAMAIWGLYGDLHSYATFDFVSRRSPPKDHCQSFGIIGIFKSLGYLVAPLIAGIVAVNVITFFPYSLSLSFVSIALVFYLLLIEFSPKRDSPLYDHKSKYRRYNFFREFKLIKQVGSILFPVLIFNIVLSSFDSTFWTIGPLFSQSFANKFDLSGLFMAAYSLPVLIINWFVNPVVNRFGKKRTAYVTFIIGNLFLVPLFYVVDPIKIIILVFISSLLNSISWPALAGAYADYISESHIYEKEIEALSDFTGNLGYIIGPVFAGFLADAVGIKNVFSYLACFSIMVTLILLFITPKHIQVVIHRHV